jgi:hypothetical protein
MSVQMKIYKLVLGISFFFMGHAAFAGVAACQSGYQDNACMTRLVYASQSAQTCSTDPGWVTITPAKWAGSHYTAPQCSYQAPPTCPSGFDQQTPPSWNGSSWVGISCLPQVPRATLPEQAAACAATNFFPTQLNKSSSIYTAPSNNSFSSAGSMTGAAANSNVYVPIVNKVNVVAPAVGCFGGHAIYQGTNPGSSDGTVYDVFTAEVAAMNPNNNQWGDSAASVCYVAHGTTNVAYQSSVGVQKDSGTCH